MQALDRGRWFASGVRRMMQSYRSQPGQAAGRPLPNIEKQDWSLSIPLDVARPTTAAATSGVAAEPESLTEAWAQWKADGAASWRQMDDVTAMLDGLVAEEVSDRRSRRLWTTPTRPADRPAR